jgi:multidrug efflux pump subunit AcrA (membrane-fusion protein)
MSTAVPEIAVGPVRRRSLAEFVNAEAQSKARRRALVLALGVALALAAFALWMVVRPRPVTLAARFRTEAASRGDVVREVRATGHVEAVTTVQVGAEISGRIAAVLVDYNDSVKAGQVSRKRSSSPQKARCGRTFTRRGSRTSIKSSRT